MLSKLRCTLLLGFFFPCGLLAQNSGQYTALFGEPTLETAYPFHEQRALVVIGDHYQYLTDKGMRLPFLFKRASEHPGFFENGRALIYTPGGKYGYINPEGLLVIDTMYTYARPFSDSLAVIRRNGFWGYIDIHGKEVLSFTNKYDILTPFKNDVAVVYNTGNTLSDDLQFGVINKKGEVIIPLQFNRIAGFNEGYAIAGREKDGGVGIIDKTGKFVVPERYEVLSDVHEGACAFQTAKSNKWGFINLEGKEIVPAIYEYVGDFHDGLAYVVNEGQKTGFINKKGVVVIGFRFKDAGDFSEGLAAAAVDTIKNNKRATLYGYINRQDHWVIEPSFESAMPCTDGKMLVSYWVNNQLKQAYIQKK
ncbi:WG repeat-containing protein [Niabella drilacis]|uniref:WG containing repeat-containing protein n=1 Tax=Niabella drilacis (strain DSM 25811 / CCM 8410 / CCUG 62505 / LMG 26954 / E90) TaxID=1285928 RepID=A0A1G6PE63_NIADE|nr:WG repeat-containing protein [Niabella drilacis]SDC78308.1 WG containing repeat-containing protein [Niabella drilacis]